MYFFDGKKMIYALGINLENLFTRFNLFFNFANKFYNVIIYIFCNK